MNLLLDIGAALAWLDEHTNAEASGLSRAPGARGGIRRPSLERMRPLCALLGDPQHDQRSIHITGTNGKTTTARMTAHLLTRMGLSVGAYTSPHLERLNERMTQGGEAVGDGALAEVLSVVAAAEGALGGLGVGDQPSWFEIVTAAAYRFFSDVAVEVAVVEVGLGGTWDATNVVDAEVAVVTNVDVDHVEYLGPTRESISTEKAGIVKPGATLVLGETDPSLTGIFLARDPGEVWRRGPDFDVDASRLSHGGREVTLRTPSTVYEGLYLPLHGAFSADNAAVALTAAEVFAGEPLPGDLVEEALADFRNPGRVEVVGQQPLVVLDGAHNVAGADALSAALEDEFPDGPRTLVVGLLREKDPAAMLRALGGAEAELIFVCRPPSNRALDPAVVARAALEMGIDKDRVAVVDDVGRALRRAIDATAPDGCVVVAGSLYLVGEARRHLTSRRGRVGRSPGPTSG